MTLTDFILIIIIVLILGWIIYNNFIKQSFSPCDTCPKKKRSRGKMANRLRNTIIMFVKPKISKNQKTVVNS